VYNTGRIIEQSNEKKSMSEIELEKKVLEINNIKTRLKDIKVFALDMDGTIYLGNKIFPFTKSFLEGLVKAGKDFVFLTNNSSKNASDYFHKLEKMGIEIERSQVYTSGDATIEYLKGKQPGAKIFLMGTKNLEDDFRKAGFNLVDRNPDFVVLGFDLTFTYNKFEKACNFIRQGVPFIATHPDYNCPLENGNMIPDCGALSAAITAATGVAPKVIGKPNKEMLEGLLSRTKVKKEELCIIGDRLITDIMMGQNFGILNILVLTGEAKKEDLYDSSVTPDFIVEKNIDLLSFL
jgi:HAD superfamily hydrolase (TIGR01457 family)